MPSIPTHFLVAAALEQAAGARPRGDWRFWTAVMVCSALPDIDVIGFGFGVRYGDLWGHRGMTIRFCSRPWRALLREVGSAEAGWRKSDSVYSFS